MPSDLNRRHRRSIRMCGYDYSQPGAYFVTICTHQGNCLFGRIVEDEMRLSEYGQIVHEEWLQTGVIRSYVALDVFVVMPNHVHGILWITDKRADVSNGRGMTASCPYKRQFGKPVAGSLSAIVQAFKAVVTKRIRAQAGVRDMLVWQRNYWEHVIRGERALAAIRQYIVDNPARWSLDRYNPDAQGRDPRGADLWHLLREGH